jgi:hypothetical protein
VQRRAGNRALRSSARVKIKIENIFAPQKRSAGVDTERIERRNLVAQSGRAKGFLQGA